MQLKWHEIKLDMTPIMKESYGSRIFEKQKWKDKKHRQTLCPIKVGMIIWHIKSVKCGFVFSVVRKWVKFSRNVS